MELKAFLPWASTVGAGLITYWIFGEVPALENLAPRAKRRAAYVMSALIAILAYLAMVAMRYTPLPTGVRAWIEALFLVGSGAFGLSQIIHGERRLGEVDPSVAKPS